MIRAHIFYSGRVQGVGFRYTTEAFAVKLDLKGWVRNLADGRVEMMVEGDEKKVEQLCQELEKQFEGYVKNKEIKIDRPVQKEFRGFKIA